MHQKLRHVVQKSRKKDSGMVQDKKKFVREGLKKS
jgi:hypothetical protein